MSNWFCGHKTVCICLTTDTRLCVHNIVGTLISIAHYYIIQLDECNLELNFIIQNLKWFLSFKYEWSQCYI